MAQKNYFLHLMLCGASGRAPQAQNADWDEIIRLAMLHNVLPIIYDGICRLPQHAAPPQEIMLGVKTHSFGLSMRQLKSYEALNAVLTRFKACNINVIVFKGIVLSKLYRNMLSRTTCDSDLLISPGDYEKAKNILQEIGYAYEKKSSADNVKSFVSDDLSIDLHTRLWGDAYGRHNDVAEKMELDSFRKCITVNLAGMNVDTLGLEEHFIFLLIHLAKHFVVKGAGARHLLDMALYYNAYAQDMDTQKLWTSITELGFQKLYGHIFKICVDHLEMNPQILEFYEHEPDTDISDKLLEDILDAGVFGNAPERAVANDVLRQSYYVGITNKSRGKLKLHFLFPSAHALSIKYRYAKKFPILLPIAWIHRLSSFLLHWIARKEKLNLSGTIDMADKRIRLLADLNLIR